MNCKYCEYEGKSKRAISIHTAKQHLEQYQQEEMGDVSNLQFILWKENLQKGGR